MAQRTQIFASRIVGQTIRSVESEKSVGLKFHCRPCVFSGSCFLAFGGFPSVYSSVFQSTALGCKASQLQRHNKCAYTM